jgi:hypothetical protein
VTQLSDRGSGMYIPLWCMVIHISCFMQNCLFHVQWNRGALLDKHDLLGCNAVQSEVHCHSYEMLVDLSWTSWCYNSDGHTLHSPCYKYLRSNSDVCSHVHETVETLWNLGFDMKLLFV